MTVNPTGSSQSTAEVEEIETNRLQVVGARSVSTPMAGYRVLFSLGLPAGAAEIVNISCEIAVIFDILR